MQVTYWMLLPAPPNCRPPEGEAVDMVMERLEQIKCKN